MNRTCLALAACLLFALAAPAAIHASEADLRDLIERLNDLHTPVDAAEAGDIAGDASAAVSNLAATPGISSRGVPNRLAAYYLGLRVASLLWHGHGWAGDARGIVNTVHSEIQSVGTPEADLLAAGVDQQYNSLAGAADNVRLDRDGFTGGGAPPPEPPPTTNCMDPVNEDTVWDVSVAHVGSDHPSWTVTGQGSQGGVSCDVSDPVGVWRSSVRVHGGGPPFYHLVYVDTSSWTHWD